MNDFARLGCTILLLAGVSCAADNGASKKAREPMDGKQAGPFLIKGKFRTAGKDGYKVEIWFSQPNESRSPINPGYRIYLPDASEDRRPEVTFHVVLKKAGDKEIVAQATGSPEMKKTAIDDGYWEEVNDDELNLKRTGKFIGQKGVWEIGIYDPLNMDYRKPGFVNPRPGQYSVSVRIEIKNGPSFQFDDIPYRRRGGREPADDPKD